jgi:hypothetical protein
MQLNLNIGDAVAIEAALECAAADYLERAAAHDLQGSGLGKYDRYYADRDHYLAGVMRTAIVAALDPTLVAIIYPLGT